jgi:hypothetical protein
VPLGPCGPLDRLYDVVELPGAGLRRLGGTPLPRLGVLAFRGEVATPIPFQVDERRGRKLALRDGPEPTDDDRPGLLDGDDSFVFMACDAGEQASPAVLARALEGFAPVTAWRELRVEDPVRSTSGFVYVVVADHPPATDRRYVTYAPAADLVTTAGYRVGLVGALPTYLTLSLAGPPGPNLVDGLRLRAEATLLANLARWTMNERDGRHELIAWSTGPVRVVRRSRHHVAVGLGINLTAGTAHTYFYARHVVGPGSLKLPFSPSVLFREITAFGGADGRDLHGWRYHAPGTPREGLAVDGRMDETERSFHSTGEWFSLAHGREAILFVTRMSENLAKVVRLGLVYRDDAATPAPPEESPGTVPLVGYEGRHVEQLPGGRYTFELRIYGLGDYRPGAEERVLAELATPIIAAVSAEGPVPSAPGAGAAEPPASR